MEEMGNNLWQYRTAIHEAAHVAVRYIMFGNIDIVKSVSVGETSRSIGRVTEDIEAKYEEYMDAMEEPLYLVGGFAFKECCYSLAGCVADMIFDGLQEIPFTNSYDDFLSFEEFIGLSTNQREEYIKIATPETMKIVKDNLQSIKQLAAAIIAAPGMELSNDSLNEILPNLFRA